METIRPLASGVIKLSTPIYHGLYHGFTNEMLLKFFNLSSLEFDCKSQQVLKDTFPSRFVTETM